jgi:aminoglycoside phosphotransferase
MLEANPANGQQLNGGYLNSVVRHGHSVRKVYLGTQAAARRLREYRALARLAGRLSVPGVLPGGDDHTLVFEFVDSVNGQRLIRDGHPGLVLRLCGAMLRKLQAFDVSSMQGMLSGSGEVITHGDFGPQNVLIPPGPQEISAVIDWEYCRLGDPIEGLAWAEWIIRRHHRDTIEFLPELFAGYGREPAWAERKQSMLKACAACDRSLSTTAATGTSRRGTSALPRRPHGSSHRS